MMMPPLALAKLRAIRDAMPTTVRYGAEPSGLVVLRGRSNEGARPEPQGERAERKKRRVWPPPGEVAAIFREAQRRYR